MNRVYYVKKYSNFDPKKWGVLITKGALDENNAIFEVFRKSLTDKWLHGCPIVNGRFTKDGIAKG